MLRYALFRREDKVISCLIDRESDRTIEIHADAVTGKAAVGDIVTARIDKIDTGLGAAFLMLSGAETGYIPLPELDHAFFTRRGSGAKYCQGDELLVQVRQEAIKGKAVTVTGELSLTGSLVVAGCRYAPGETGSVSVRVSKKIHEPLRSRLKEMAGVLIPAADGEERWVLLRTQAGALPDDGAQAALADMIASAFERLETVVKRASFLACGTVHVKSPAPYLKRIEQIPREQLEKVITEDPLLFEQLEEAFAGEIPVILYSDPMVSLFNLYRMSSRLDEALGKIVHLKSGGSLIIEPTQALTVIDVNTGKSSRKNAVREEQLLRTNLEGAMEAARQIRLRNLSGIIIIDFINMKEEASVERLLSECRRAFLSDPVETKLVDLTKLGLAEITRKKVERPLHEAMGRE